MAETQEQKKRAENFSKLTERFSERNNSNMMNLISKFEENTKKQNEANEQRIKDGNRTQSEINELKEVVKTGRIDGQFASKEQIAIAQREIDISERGSSSLIARVREQSDKFVEDARSKEKQRVADLNLRKEELVTLKEMAKGVGTFSPEEQASAQLELKRYEENQKKIGIFTKIANRTVQTLEDIGAPEEGESAEAKEQRLAGQKVFGKIRDGVTKTGKAFDEFAGKYGKAAKEGGLKLLKGFAIGIIIISLLKFIKSPAFDDLLNALGGFFGFIDTLVEQFGLAATATLALVALFKPSIFMGALKLAILALKGGYKFLTDATVRQAADVKMTKAFTKLGNGVKFLGDGIKSAGASLMNAGAKGLEFGKTLGTSALSLGGKALTGIRTAGLVMKTAMIALGKGLLTFATTTLMPMLIPLTPFIAIGAAIAAVLYSLYEGFQSFRDSLASGDSLVDAIISGVSTALATLVSLPAVMFQKLLEFATGLLGFDDLSERIGNVDIIGTISGLIKDGLSFIKDFFVDLFTFDDDLFPSFGDFGSFFQKATASLLRSVLPSPDALTFTLPKLDVPFVGEIGGQTISLNPIPDSVYKAAGMNPETGEIMTKPNTGGIDGVEGAAIQQVSELEKEQTDNMRDARAFKRDADKLTKLKGTRKTIAQRNMAFRMNQEMIELEAEEEELAIEGKSLGEYDQRKLDRLKRVDERLKFQGITDGAAGLMDVEQAIKHEQMQSQMFATVNKAQINNLGADIEAVDDTKLVTNQFRGMDGIDVSAQKNETATIVEKLRIKSTGIDEVAGGVKSQVDAITKLIDPDQINAMRDKVARINQILKDGVTDEERTELSTMGIDTSRNFVQRTFNMDAGVTEESRAEAVRLRDAILKNTADQQAIQKTAGSVNNVVAPTYNTSNSKSSVVSPTPHNPANPPPGTSSSYAFK